MDHRFQPRRRWRGARRHCILINPFEKNIDKRSEAIYINCIEAVQAALRKEVNYFDNSAGPSRTL